MAIRLGIYYSILKFSAYSYYGLLGIGCCAAAESAAVLLLRCCAAAEQAAVLLRNRLVCCCQPKPAMIGIFMTYYTLLSCDDTLLLICGFSAAGEKQQQRQTKLKVIRQWHRTCTLAKGTPQLYPGIKGLRMFRYLILNIFSSRKTWEQAIDGPWLSGDKFGQPIKYGSLLTVIRSRGMPFTSSDLFCHLCTYFLLSSIL